MNPWIVFQLSNLHSIFPFPSFGKSDQIWNREDLYFFPCHNGEAHVCTQVPPWHKNSKHKTAFHWNQSQVPPRSVLQKGAHPFSPQSCEILWILDKCRSQCALNYCCSCSPVFAVVQGMLRSTAPKYKLESHWSLMGLMLPPSQKPQREWGTICLCLFWFMQDDNPEERKLLQNFCHFSLLTHFPAKLKGLCPWENLQVHGKRSGKSDPQTFRRSHGNEIKEQKKKEQVREDGRASWFWTGFLRVKACLLQS